MIYEIEPASDYLQGHKRFECDLASLHNNEEACHQNEALVG